MKICLIENLHSTVIEGPAASASAGVLKTNGEMWGRETSSILLSGELSLNGDMARRTSLSLKIEKKT